MAKDLLTDKAIRAAQPREKPYKLADGAGMSLVVSPTGAKTFRLKYRFKGIERSYSCGSYPKTSLAQARKNREAAHALIAEGKDPVKERRNDRAAAGEARKHTFEAAAEAFYAKGAPAWSTTHCRDVRRILDTELLPALGRKALHVITPEDVQAVINGIEGRGAYTFARDVRMYARAIWRSSRVAKKLADPTAEVEVTAKKLLPKEKKHRPHPALPRTELGEFMRRVRNSPATPMVRLALLLLLHTGVRSGELRGATWGEFNLAEALWVIPGDRMKNDLDFIVPLTPQVVDLLAQLRACGAEMRGVNERDLRADDLLLFNAFDFAQPLSDGTLSHAIWRAGYKKTHTPHGCRAVFSTWANEIGGFNPDAVERQLAHVPNDLRTKYNRADYLPERVKMMAAWSNYLDEQERTAKVIPFPAPLAVAS